MIKPENIQIIMVMLLVYFASDQVAGLFLGRWVMLVTAFPVNGKSKVKYTTERGELCHFYFHITTLRWFLCHQHHSDIHLYSFLNIWLRQKEALCQKTKQKRGHALAWCLTVSTTQQLEQNSAMPQCCVSLKTTAAIKMSLCNKMNIPSRHFKMEDNCTNAAS